MDETPLTFDVLSNRTVAMKGAKTVTTKQVDKKRTTLLSFQVVLTVLNLMLNAVIIFKHKTMPKASERPPGVVHIHDKLEGQGWHEIMD